MGIFNNDLQMARSPIMGSDQKKKKAVQQKLGLSSTSLKN